MPKVKKTNKTANESVFCITVNVGGKDFETKGDTILECLEKLEIDKFSIKGNAIITASKGELKSEVMFYPFKLRRLLVNNVIKILLAKRLTTSLR